MCEKFGSRVFTSPFKNRRRRRRRRRPSAKLTNVLSHLQRTTFSSCRFIFRLYYFHFSFRFLLLDFSFRSFGSVHSDFYFISMSSMEIRRCFSSWISIQDWQKSLCAVLRMERGIARECVRTCGSNVECCVSCLLPPSRVYGWNNIYCCDFVWLFLQLIRWTKIIYNGKIYL